MRSLSFIVPVALAFMAALAPVAEANKYSKKSGSKFKVRVGQKTTIKVTGFNGCKFEALHDNSGTGKNDTDPDVATVTTPGKEGKSQVVTITAVGIGETQVDLITMGESPSCNGFTATYFFAVVPDDKAFLKQVKGKLKDATKTAKSDMGFILDLYCDVMADLTKSVKAGSVDPEDALAEGQEALQLVADFFDVGMNDQLNDTFQDIWGRSTEAGFFLMDPTLAGLLPGGCGEWDKFSGSIKKLAEKSTRKATKKYKSLVKTIDKVLAAQDDVLVQIAQALGINLGIFVPVPIPVANPQPQPAPPPKPLKKNFTSSGRLSSSETTRLQIGGSADPAGGNVTVDITGPGGVMTQKVVPVGKGCNWVVDFTGLAPGTYTVKLSQTGADSVTFTTYGA